MDSPQPRTAGVFSKGDRVEVTSDEEGFRGSWFSGTVKLRLRNGMYLVEYDNLLADEGSEEKLMEELEERQLRPLPPEEIGLELRFGDEVDAFHNDGWWEGHITRELGGGRFVVYFRGSREQIEFSRKDLRLHHEWTHGKWDPPIQQQQEEVLLTPNSSSNGVMGEDEEKYSVGKPVEVSSDEDGFQGAWFSATIVQVMENEKFLVEYKTLLDDDSQLLKEEVDIDHIRPDPPELHAVGDFRPLQEVDALYNDGWWVGVISRVLGNSGYMVYFKSSKEEIEFKHSELRLHQDWTGSKWVTATEALPL